MIFKPHPLSVRLDPQELAADKKQCKKYGPCGVGEKALYLNSFFLDRRFYVPISQVRRVYKRIAMSKGGFTGKGLFATMPYLVVEYDKDKTIQCNFKHEENVDRMVARLQQTHPELKFHSKAAEAKLREKARREEARKVKNLSPTARETIRTLEQCQRYLEHNQDLFIELTAAAKRKRANDRSNPAYKWVALAIVLMAVVAVGYGVYSFLNGGDFSLYFLLFGLGAIFLFSSANVLPTARNNNRAIQQRLDDAVAKVEAYLRQKPDFPVPARYAHPMTMKRMRNLVEWGKAETMEEAFAALKADLKAMNASVTVEQEEFDEIMSIKPMFLVYQYQ